MATEAIGMKNLEIREKVVSGRKPHRCRFCRQFISVGEKHTYFLQHTTYHGDLRYRICQQCKPITHYFRGDTHMKNPAELVESLYEGAKDLFVADLHNLLWQLIINKTFGTRNVALTPVIGERMTVGVAELGVSGYTPTPATFRSDLIYDRACDVCDELNKKIFGLTKKEGLRIVASSMRGRVSV